MHMSLVILYRLYHTETETLAFMNIFSLLRSRGIDRKAKGESIARTTYGNILIGG